MAPRSFWKGYLKLSLVTCPVAMVPATSENEKVRFHTLNSKTGNRVVSQYVDAVSGKSVDEDDEVKGYPRGEDEYVILEDDELEAVALESTRTIDIDMFVSADSIEWIWYDKPHYLTPDDPVGEEAFSVIRDAMESTGTVGVSRLVLYRRERAVMLEPRDRGHRPLDPSLWRRSERSEGIFRKDRRWKNRRGSDEACHQADRGSHRALGPQDGHGPGAGQAARHHRGQEEGSQTPGQGKGEAAAPPINVISIMDALKKSIASESKLRRSR